MSGFSSETPRETGLTFTDYFGILFAPGYASRISDAKVNDYLSNQTLHNAVGFPGAFVGAVGVISTATLAGYQALAGWLMPAAAAAVGAEPEMEDIAVEYTPRVLSRMAELASEPFHNFPSSFNPYVIQNGYVGAVGENYLGYRLPGWIASPHHKFVLPKPPVPSRLVLVVLSAGDYPIHF